MRRAAVIKDRPTRAIGYLRVSTAKQADHGVSLEAQEERIRLYAQMHGLELVRIETDAGESASSLDRPGLQRALAALETFEANAIIVVKLDRITRSVRDFAHLVDTYFKDGDCALMSVNESIDTRSASGRLVLNVLMTISEWERESAIERTTAVMQHLKATGKFTGGWPPYGWMVGDDGELVVNEVEQDVVRRACRLHADGHSLRTIATYVGPNNRTGKPFDHKQIQRMVERDEALKAS